MLPTTPCLIVAVICKVAEAPGASVPTVQVLVWALKAGAGLALRKVSCAGKASRMVTPVAGEQGPEKTPAFVQSVALRTVNVDSSAPALELARRNYTLNGHDPAAHAFIDSDVTRYLQSAAAAGEAFDMVILDPPAFAKSLSAKEKALRAYERLNMLGVRVVAPGGLLLTCSCSGGVDSAEFETAVRVALARAGRMAQIITFFGPSLDHPTLPGFVEDRYLKALLLRVL